MQLTDLHRFGLRPEQLDLYLGLSPKRKWVAGQMMLAAAYHVGRIHVEDFEAMSARNDEAFAASLADHITSNLI